MLWEGGTLQSHTMDAHGECSQCVDHTALTTGQGGMCFLGLHCSGSRVLYKGTVPSVLCIWCAFQVQAAQVLRWWERGLYGSWLALLWYLLNPLFCEHVRGHLAVLEPFMVKVFFFFFWSFWRSHGLGCYLMLVPSDCPQGFQPW